MIEGIHLYDQALAFIKLDALNVVIHNSGVKNVDGGTSVNAYEVLAREFEHYWRSVIGQEVAKQFNLDPTNPDVLLLTIWKAND
jgi:hypothetical protein